MSSHIPALEQLKDCRTCVHNTYKAIETDFVSCSHPVTLKKAPDWEAGDPAMVNYRTGDVRVCEIGEFKNCPTWERYAHD